MLSSSVNPQKIHYFDKLNLFFSIWTNNYALCNASSKIGICFTSNTMYKNDSPFVKNMYGIFKAPAPQKKKKSIIVTSKNCGYGSLKKENFYCLFWPKTQITKRKSLCIEKGTMGPASPDQSCGTVSWELAEILQWECRPAKRRRRCRKQSQTTKVRRRRRRRRMSVRLRSKSDVVAVCFGCAKPSRPIGSSSLSVLLRRLCVGKNLPYIRAVGLQVNVIGFVLII